MHYSPRAWTDEHAQYQPDDWRYDTNWPPYASHIRQWRLCADAAIRPVSAGKDELDQARHWRYDPRHPIPTIGGRNMLIAPGALDQRPLQDLSDYGLVYRTEPLATPLQIADPVSVNLHLESDCADTDVIVKVIEEHADGAAILLLDGVSQLLLREPARGPQPLSHGEIVSVHIELGRICHTLAACNRLRVDVTSSNFPRRAHNTNSGNLQFAADTQADIRIAHNTLHHGADTPAVFTMTLLE